MQAKELKELNSLFSEVQKEKDLISDLDEINSWFDKDVDKTERTLELLNKAFDSELVKTWIENGRGISFKCWTWKHDAYMIARDNNFELINPDG